MNKGQMRRLALAIVIFAMIMTIGITILGSDSLIIAFMLGFVLLLMGAVIVGGAIYALYSLLMWIIGD